LDFDNTFYFKRKNAKSYLDEPLGYWKPTKVYYSEKPAIFDYSTG
jgi:hypothetical protein